MGKNPKLTVGMATAYDAEGLYWTITNLRLDHQDVIPDVEIIVVDDAPCTRTDSHTCHSHATQHILGSCINSMEEAKSGSSRSVCQHPANIRYIQNDKAHGTTQSRNRIFEEASGDYVLVIDSHVKPWPGTLARLIEFYDKGLDNDGDLLHGPLWYDDLAGYASHFDDVIRGNMWGIWGEDPRAEDPEAEPFEIAAQGLGLFSCRRDKWLGFNSRFRGFGGEEFYIHEKYRKAGRKAQCLPFLRWAHRFMRLNGTGYTNDLRHRVRNYLIGYKELGLPIDRLRRYFRDGIAEDPQNDSEQRTRISRNDWELLCLDLEIDP